MDNNRGRRPFQDDDIVISRKSLDNISEVEQEVNTNKNSQEIRINRSQTINVDENPNANLNSPKRKFLEKKRGKLGEKDEEAFDKIHPYELNPFEIGLKNSLFFRIHIAGFIEYANVSFIYNSIVI